MNNQKSFVATQLLYDQILQYLRDLILSGQFEEDKKLNEIELQKLLGTSRAPIREAFRRLEAEGLVEIRPRKGVHVRSLSLQDLREAAQVRVVLEKLGVKLAIKNVTPQDLAALSAILTEMSDALITKHDIDAYTSAHYRFHRYLVDKSGNQVLSRTYSTVTEPFVTRRATYRYLQKRSGSESAHHRELFEALARGDEDRLDRLIEAHVMSIVDSVDPSGEVS